MYVSINKLQPKLLIFKHISCHLECCIVHTLQHQRYSMYFIFDNITYLFEYYHIKYIEQYFIKALGFCNVVLISSVKIILYQTKKIKLNEKLCNYNKFF